jgi:hypothetical protein
MDAPCARSLLDELFGETVRASQHLRTPVGRGGPCSLGQHSGSALAPADTSGLLASTAPRVDRREDTGVDPDQQGNPRSHQATSRLAPRTNLADHGHFLDHRRVAVPRLRAGERVSAFVANPDRPGRSEPGAQMLSKLSVQITAVCSHPGPASAWAAPVGSGFKYTQPPCRPMNHYWRACCVKQTILPAKASAERSPNGGQVRQRTASANCSIWSRRGTVVLKINSPRRDLRTA